jgi:hypothetical protein
MAKKVTGQIKLQIPGGQANPAPPVGPALGQHGVNIMEFCKAFNARTQDKQGLIIPAVITTGSISPGSTLWVWALKALQNSMMFSPRWPSAGPTGGEGFALPAGICSLMKPTIFLAMKGSYPSSNAGRSQLLVTRP